MSEPGFVSVSELGAGMIALRGDLRSKVFRKAAEAGTGLKLPAPCTIVWDGARALGWMAPDELLLVVPEGEGAVTVAALEHALAGQHALVADVSDARAMFHISGPGAREALAKLTPADLSPAAFPVGTLRRTRLGQVAGALWAEERGLTVLCFRSVAVYMRDLLADASHPDAALRVF
ncbi:sarcosine oxidase subunit gamma [Rhodovulum imhoffii]|uniref:Sarcosine oxidase subunit gamma n=1 Tax=Rhodovulum imhoffii TaxID=365340 RepID=A0A2T5BQ03_9RHOB|nr:sarcosine oxidase subunit gamma family protein [Rhodovulum imhoffii]MBK5934092.1 hypothetical protein [Rhodovulum imhoffii]PTN01161.1 sarcosine oxidase subunit gamma [Rhodovulum imhoffii]